MKPVGLISLVVAAGLGVACADQGPDAVPGTYLLQSIDGKGAPFAEFVSYNDAVIDGEVVLVEEHWELISDTLRLDPGGTLDETGVARWTVRAFDQFGAVVLDTTWVEASSTTTGTYTVAGRTVEIAYSSGQAATGTIDGDVLEVVNAAGATHRYRRRG